MNEPIETSAEKNAIHVKPTPFPNYVIIVKKKLLIRILLNFHRMINI